MLTGVLDPGNKSRGRKEVVPWPSSMAEDLRGSIGLGFRNKNFLFLFLILSYSWVCGCTSVIPALRRLSPKDGEFKTTLAYMARTCLKQKKKKQRKKERRKEEVREGRRREQREKKKWGFRFINYMKQSKPLLSGPQNREVVFHHLSTFNYNFVL